MSRPARRSICFWISSGIHWDARSSGDTCRPPTAPRRARWPAWSGRNQLSAEARNSLSFSSSARRLVNVESLGPHDLAMHQVVHRLADEGVARERRAEQIVAIDDRAVGRGEAIGGVQVVEAGERAAARKHFGRAGLLGHVDAAVGRRHVRVAAQVVVGQHELVHRVAVCVAEPVVPIVAVAAVLRGAGLRIEQALVGPDAKVAAVGARRVSPRLDAARSGRPPRRRARSTASRRGPTSSRSTRCCGLPSQETADTALRACRPCRRRRCPRRRRCRARR